VPFFLSPILCNPSYPFWFTLFRRQWLLHILQPSVSRPDDYYQASVPSRSGTPIDRQQPYASRDRPISPSPSGSSIAQFQTPNSSSFVGRQGSTSMENSRLSPTPLPRKSTESFHLPTRARSQKDLLRFGPPQEPPLPNQTGEEEPQEGRKGKRRMSLYRQDDFSRSTSKFEYGSSRGADVGGGSGRPSEEAHEKWGEFWNDGKSG